MSRIQSSAVVLDTDTQVALGPIGIRRMLTAINTFAASSANFRTNRGGSSVSVGLTPVVPWSGCMYVANGVANTVVQMAMRIPELETIGQLTVIWFKAVARGASNVTNSPVFELWRVPRGGTAVVISALTLTVVDTLVSSAALTTLCEPGDELQVRANTTPVAAVFDPVYFSAELRMSSGALTA